MSKKHYLVEGKEMFAWRNTEIFQKSDAKEVEVLDIDEVYQDAVKSGYMTITQYLKANKYLIVKIVE